MACACILGGGAAAAEAVPSQTGAATSPAPAVQLLSVTFHGSATDPTIIIHGRDLGSAPTPSPRGGTSNFGLCGPIAGHTGYDFGSQLWIEDETQRWSGGYSGYVDCMGLIVTKYKSTEIVYKLGSWYRLHYAQRNRFPHGIYKLASGDVVNLKVRGANLRAIVHYTSGTKRRSTVHVYCC